MNSAQRSRRKQYLEDAGRPADPPKPIPLSELRDVNGQLVPLVFRRPAEVEMQIRIVAGDYGVSPKMILYGGNRRACVVARRALIHRLYEKGYGISDIGRFLGMHHSTILYHLNRERPKLDRTTPGPVPYPDLSGEWAI